jgi:hypothetical protein
MPHVETECNANEMIPTTAAAFFLYEVNITELQSKLPQ